MNAALIGKSLFYFRLARSAENPNRMFRSLNCQNRKIKQSATRSSSQAASFNFASPVRPAASGRKIFQAKLH
jgi:hypothetical protein